MIAIREMALWTNRSNRGPLGPRLCCSGDSLPCWNKRVNIHSGLHQPEGADHSRGFVRMANVPSVVPT
jgi:hypothetical protein